MDGPNSTQGAGAYDQTTGNAEAPAETGPPIETLEDVFDLTMMNAISLVQEIVSQADEAGEFDESEG